MNRSTRTVPHADWHLLLTNEQLERAEKRVQERLDEMERSEIRRRIRRKIPALIKKIEKNIRRSNKPEAVVIVSPFLAYNNHKLVEEVVNDELTKAGVPSLHFVDLYFPRSNPYVPIPSGIFTRLRIRKTN